MGPSWSVMDDSAEDGNKYSVLRMVLITLLVRSYTDLMPVTAKHALSLEI